jgi:hypothetical protein
MMNGKVAQIPAMFQKALSVANSRPCSRPKKTSETTASWGREAARPPPRAEALRYRGDRDDESARHDDLPDEQRH